MSIVHHLARAICRKTDSPLANSFKLIEKKTTYIWKNIDIPATSNNLKVNESVIVDLEDNIKVEVEVIDEVTGERGYDIFDEKKDVKDWTKGFKKE